MIKEDRIIFSWGITGLIGFGYFLFSLIPFHEFEYLIISKRFWFFVFYNLLLLSLIVWEIIVGRKTNWKKGVFSFLNGVPKLIRDSISILLLFFPVITFLFVSTPNLTFTYLSKIILSISCIVWSVLLKSKKDTSIELIKSFIITGVILGVLYSLGQLFNQVTNYPFSLHWSEGNRLWDYSIRFDSDRYITSGGGQIKAFIDEGRSLLWGTIFLIPNIGILGARFLDAMIKSLPYFGLGIILIWQDRKRISRIGIIVFVLWAFLFLRQGPIYSPLILSAILVVYAIGLKNFWLAIILVIVSSYFAEMTRFNWTYAPGLWAGMLSLLQITNPALKKMELKKFIRPIVFGLAGYFGGQFLPQLVKNIFNPERSESISIIVDFQNTRAFKQDLLWDRWWPNFTYGPGIIPSLLIAVLPVLLVLVYLYSKKKWNINWMQILCVLIPGILFLGVGLIASVKIGGSGDLHNLDMFFIFLLLLIGINWRHVWGYFTNHLNNLFGFILITIMLIFPVFFSFQSGNPLNIQSDNRVSEVMIIIQNEVDRAQSDNGEVLFMDQRQLITFDFIQNVLMVDEYDKKRLIDESFISQSKVIFRFQEDLKNQRFDIILSNIIKTDYQYDNPFSEENNYWVDYVAIPILEYYEPIYTFEDLDIQLLAPIID